MEKKTRSVEMLSDSKINKDRGGDVQAEMGWNSAQ